MKEIKDYLPFYIGSDCMIGDLGWKKQKIHPNDLAPYTNLDYGRPIKSKVDLHTIQAFGNQITLILRPLNSLSKQEMEECGNLDYDFSGEPELNKWTWKDFNCLLTPNQFTFLLSKHFDLFELIESGLAIDKKNFNQ